MAIPVIEVYHKTTGQRTWMAESALAIFTDYAAVPVTGPAPGPFDPFPVYLTDAEFIAATGNAASPIGAAQRAASVSAVALALAAEPDTLIAGAIARDGNGAATSAPVKWPDGTAGLYTATTVSSAFPGAVDAYTITYGDPATKTYTQAAVTRDASGAVTQRPALAVS